MTSLSLFTFIHWRRKWQPTPVFLLGESQGWGSLVGCSPRGREELDTTEQLRFHFSLSCIGEGNGNPLQCSCLENPRDGGAWWAAVCGVVQSWTPLKRLSSSSVSRQNPVTHRSGGKDIGVICVSWERVWLDLQGKALQTQKVNQRRCWKCPLSVCAVFSELVSFLSW